MTTPHPDGGGELVLITLSSFPLQKTPAQIRAVLLVQPARCHLTVQQSQPRRRVHNRSGLSVCLACECTSGCSRIFSSWSTEAVRLHSDCTAAVEITPTAMAGDKERCLGTNASESAGLCRWSWSWIFFAHVKLQHFVAFRTCESKERSRMFTDLLNDLMTIKLNGIIIQTFVLTTVLTISKI